MRSTPRAAPAPLVALVTALVTGLVTGLATLLLPVLPASAADDPIDPGAPAPTTLALGVEPGYAGSRSRLEVTLRGADEAPVAGGPVTLERRLDGTWQVVAELVTDAGGVAEARRRLVRRAADNAFRASYDGDDTWQGSASGVVVADLTKRDGVLRLDGPASVVDGRAVRLRVLSRTRAGEPVDGAVVLRRRTPGGDWEVARRLETSDRGVATTRVRPRVDTRWRVSSPGQDWVRGARSEVLRVDNLPPAEPVRLPAAAPEPRIELPPQRRGTGRGANPVVTTIPDGVWASMFGRSWHEGCPVGRDGLRLLRVNYWGFDGYRYRGEVVAATGAVGAMSRALVGMYRRQLPIRSMYRVDRFGWSSVLQGADDYRSMAADNTSAFNCRQVVNRPGVRSPHSYGGSLDVNPWENPYRSATGYVPNAWWPSRSHPRVAWRSGEHAVVRVMRGAGLRWTYGTGDSHHFDVGGSFGRAVPEGLRRACAPQVVCH